ncbi:MAG: glycosyltransferase family 2 protein [Thiobacillaceae bacterium]
MENEASATGAPRFSVVIPAYNAGKTLARALDSVLAQTWPAHEIIVVDDGSHDDTDQIVAAYGDRVIALWQENAGPSAARNRGVQAASGEWVAFLDADDWYYPARLELHANMIAAEPSLDFVVGSFDYRDAGGTLIQSSIEQTMLGRRLLEQAGASGRAVIEGTAIGEFISQQFSDTRCLSIPRKTFLALGGFSINLKICEDVVLLLRLCAVSRRAGVICTSQAVYLVHDQGLIRSDRLRAQTETVRALHTLEPEMEHAPAAVHRAWQRLLKEAYRNLAYYLSKHGRKREALAGLMKSFRSNPTWRDGRDMLSVLIG